METYGRQGMRVIACAASKEAITALIGAVPRARQGLVAWRARCCCWPSPACPATSPASGWAGRFPRRCWILGFCALVLWTAWRMWRSSNLPREGSGALRSAPLVAIGLGVGLFSGLMGVGGGFLVVPALLAFTPLSMLAATATSMAVIALVSGGGFLFYLSGATPLPLLVGLALGGAAGVLGGNALAQRLGGRTLQRLFALMLVAVSLSLAAQKLLGGH